MHATEFSRKAKAAQNVPLIVLHGGERHLKQAALALLCEQILNSPLDQSIGLTRYGGKDADFKTIRDELLMVSMFSDRKLILVEDADDFITEHRASLESYADKPSKKSVLVLDVKTWRKNTRLAKKVDADGLDIDCSELTGPPLTNWLLQQAQEQHGKQLSRDAAQLMVELAGTGLGLLDQELGKLASYAGEREKISAEDVRKLVGGWKAETTWHMIDAIRDGHPGVALNCLSKLLYAGEPGPKILGGINYVFRKFAIAVERSRRGQALKEALKEAGVFPRDIANAENYLRRVKRQRAEQILEMLARADYGLKGGSRLPENLQLEMLILWLSGSAVDAGLLGADAR
ncbi:DNA polymerase III subunit delta [Planctomicrobium sp. SH664]|uniref:DNA polymerase III subunit delta n=1 Tax=Planctomicrobium sp. SH664 TaxID=3448125 RepID=UPI003F5B0575